MKRIDLFHFYRLGQYIHPTTQLRKRTLPVTAIGGADKFLRILAEPPYEPIPLKLSIASALELLAAHSNLGERYGPRILAMKPEEKSGDIYFDAAVDGAENAARNFEAVFEKELLVTPAFLVSPKGAYDTFILLDYAETAISDSARPFVPEDALKDFREAGRCLVLEVPTACGYHVTRAVEAILRQWHTLLVKGRAGEQQADKPDAFQQWGRLEKELLNAGAHRGTVGILSQIRELHRNPIMHPEVFLSIEEAMSLFDISKSAIEAMAREIGKLQPSTNR